MALVETNPPASAGDMGSEDPLEEKMTIHFSILAWEISWTEEPGGLQSRGFKESDATERLSMHAHIQSSCITIYNFIFVKHR